LLFDIHLFRLPIFRTFLILFARPSAVAEGWIYAVDFSFADIEQWGPVAANVSFCRRRRWVRHRVAALDVFEPLDDGACVLFRFRFSVFAVLLS
jgi:hypothetical protein